MEHSADAVQHSEVRINGAEVLIRAPKAQLLALRDAGVERIASQVAAKPVRIRLEAGEIVNAAPVAGPEKPQTAESEIRQRALSHPGVKRFQELFPGAQVRTVRNLNE
jgi:hypothetical protein